MSIWKFAFAFAFTGGMWLGYYCLKAKVMGTSTGTVLGIHGEAILEFLRIVYAALAWVFLLGLIGNLACRQVLHVTNAELVAATAAGTKAERLFCFLTVRSSMLLADSLVVVTCLSLVPKTWLKPGEVARTVGSKLLDVIASPAALAIIWMGAVIWGGLTHVPEIV